MQQIIICPICTGNQFDAYLTCKDFTVSHETFQLVKCNTCSLIITSPRPTLERLGDYYISDQYISHTNTRKTLQDNIYQFARHYSLNWKRKLLERYTSRTPDKALLDYGCGTGEFLKVCASHRVKIQGVEPSSIAREKAIKLTGANIAESINDVTGKFNIITLWHVLEHVPDLQQIVYKLKTHLEKNGIMFIAVPNHKSDDAIRYKELWAGYDVPRHLWHFSQSNIKQLFEQHQLSLLDTIPMKLDAYYVSLLSEKYKGEKSFVAMVKALSNGYKSNRSAQLTSEYSSLIYVAKNEAD